MKSIIISSIILAAGFLFAAKTTISLKPFKVSLEAPLFAAGLCLIAFGIAAITISVENRATLKGATAMEDRIWKEIAKQLDEADLKKALEQPLQGGDIAGAIKTGQYY